MQTVERVVRKLHFQIYQNGSIGMCNALMSIENGLILGYLMKREVVFYYEKPLYNSTKGLFITDLFNFFNCSFVKGTPPIVHTLKHDLHNTIITSRTNPPTNDFANGRTKLIVLEDYDNLLEVRTKDSNTLSFYSYLFNIKSKVEINEYLEECVKVKQIYESEATNWIKILGKYDSVNIRRGDYLKVNYAINSDILPEQIKKITNQLKNKIVIHSEETHDGYFDSISDILIQNIIANEYDPCEKGLVSLLVALEAEDFIGTHYSTFSAMIQRLRLLKGKPEKFKYAYSQEPSIKLNEDGTMKEKEGKTTWSRLDMRKDMAFWTREYNEALC